MSGKPKPDVRDDLHCVAVIHARGASKGLTDRNIRPLGGRPLIAHTIVQAREAGLFTCVAVSSDSHQILDIARHWGADQLVERPAELAADTAPTGSIRGGKEGTLPDSKSQTPRHGLFRVFIIVAIFALASPSQ